MASRKTEPTQGKLSEGTQEERQQAQNTNGKDNRKTDSNLSEDSEGEREFQGYNREYGFSKHSDAQEEEHQQDEESGAIKEMNLDLSEFPPLPPTERERRRMKDNKRDAWKVLEEETKDMLRFFEFPLLAEHANHTEGIQNDSQSPTLEDEQSEMNASTHQVSCNLSNPFQFSEAIRFCHSRCLQHYQETMMHNAKPMEVSTKPPEPRYIYLPYIPDQPVSSMIVVFPVGELNLHSDPRTSCFDMYPIETFPDVCILPDDLRNSVYSLVSHDALSFLFIHSSFWRHEKLINLEFNYDAACRFNCSLPPIVAPLHVQPPDFAVHSRFTDSVRTIGIFPSEILKPQSLAFNLKRSHVNSLTLQFDFRASVRKLNFDMKTVLVKTAIVVPAVYDDLKTIWTPAIRIPVIIPYALDPSSLTLLPVLENIFLTIERVHPRMEHLALQILSTPPSMDNELIPKATFRQSLERASLTANEGQMGHMEPTSREDCKSYNMKTIPFERRVEEQVLRNPIRAPTFHQNSTSAIEVSCSKLQNKVTNTDISFSESGKLLKPQVVLQKPNCRVGMKDEERLESNIAECSKFLDDMMIIEDEREQDSASSSDE